MLETGTAVIMVDAETVVEATTTEEAGEDSADIIIGPDPAEEVRPLSLDAIALAPWEEAIEVVAEVAVAVDDLDDDELLLMTAPAAGQVRSYKGVVLSVDPTSPKLGLGVVGAASCKVYQNVLILPSTVQATWSQ